MTLSIPSTSTLVSTIADSLRCQWRKILDHGGGAALAAMDPLVMDVARNIAQGLMLFEADDRERASTATDPTWSVAQHSMGEM